jgi:acyl carrier protein
LAFIAYRPWLGDLQHSDHLLEATALTRIMPLAQPFDRKTAPQPRQGHVRKDELIGRGGETPMKEETTVKLKSVFQKVLEENDITITREMTAQDIEKWDSLRHVQLISEVERAFGIKFKLREVLSMKNVGDLIDLIHVKQGVPA